MNVLITGAGGFIGTYLSDTIGRQHKLFRIYSSSKSVSDSNAYAVDFTDVKSVQNIIDIFSKQKIDAIIHIACKMASHDEIENLKTLKDNIAITENMVSLAKKTQPKVFINFSSMAVYPNESGIFSENCLPRQQKNTDCLYGLSKYCAETIIDFLMRNENTHIVHLRVAQVFGNGMRKDRIIPVMQKELEKTNTITLFGSGERESNFIEITKLREVVDFFLQNELSGVYNVGDKNLSYYDLAKTLVKQYGNKKSKIVTCPQGNNEKFNLDSSKLQKLMIT